MTDEVTLALLARDERIADLETVLESYRNLTRELDVLLNGEEGAATQASLCDIVAQVRRQGLRAAPGGIVCKWHPMETAPNNQTILLYTDDEDIRLVTADDNDYQWQPYRGKERHVNNPVFWMPADPLIDVAVAMLATPDVPLINEGKTDVPQLPNADDSEGGHCD